MSREKRLEAAIRRLLGCPALNLDDLEDEDRAAIRAAFRLLPKKRTGPSATRPRTSTATPKGGQS